MTRWTYLLIPLFACAATTSVAADEPTWPREHHLTSGITYKLRGRIDTDFLWTEQSAKNEADFGTLGDAAGLRRARIGIEGDLPNDGLYVAEIDLASGNVVIRDLFAGQEGCFDAQTRGGHFREPFSLEGGTSANSFAFMERSPANVLDPARNWGLGLYYLQPTQDSALSLGYFYGGPDQNDLEGGDGSTTGATGRLTFAPIDEGDGEQLLHFGVALAERLPTKGIIIINQQPQSPLLEFNDSVSSPFVPTLMIPATFQHILNAQVAAARGSLWTQAEWYGTFIDQSGGGGDVFYHGNHVDVGYFVTGEHRAYDSASGVFGPVRVNHPVFCGPASHGRSLGLGAWELTARFAWLDFFDPNTPLGPNGQQQGVELAQGTVGVNWYLTDRVRILFNYTYAEPTEPNFGQSSASVFGTRLNVFW
jgi:phosphate-selective porin OprO/OprP